MAEVGPLLVGDVLPLQVAAIDTTTAVTISTDGPSSEARVILKKRLAIGAAVTVVLALIGLAACSVHGTGEPIVSVAAFDGELMQAFTPLGSKFCGINHNPHMCEEEYGLLQQADPSGFNNIMCKCGMGESLCALDPMMNTWKKIDPSLCQDDPGVLFLWEVPDQINSDPAGFDFDPLCGYPGKDSCVEWAAKSWKFYVDQWSSELMASKYNGLKVAAPMFTGDMFSKLSDFFKECPECNDPNSPYYIDMLAFNSWVNPTTAKNELLHIRDIVNRLKTAYGNRPVIINNLGISAATAEGVASVIKYSGLFDKTQNPVDAMYWSVYPSSAFSPPLARSVLPDVVKAGPQQGKSLAKVLMEQCGQQR